MIDVIAFDADDTLWQNETLYHATQDKFKALLAPYQPEAVVEQALYETEMRNLATFGYGVKGFVLAMIETAIQVSEGAITAHEIQAIIDFAKDMLAAPVELLPGVAETVAHLSDSHDLMLITKGDLLDQETKLARSRLGDYFTWVEIVSRKNREVYRHILDRHGIAPDRFLMVGNSLRSDILPVVAIGGQAAYIPHALTWAHEQADPAAHNGAYHTLSHIRELPALLDRLVEA